MAVYVKTVRRSYSYCSSKTLNDYLMYFLLFDYYVIIYVIIIRLLQNTFGLILVSDS